MTIVWQKSGELNKVLQFGMMLDGVRVLNPARQEYVSTLAASLKGLTLEQVEDKLGKLEEGYHAYCFVTTGNKRSFRVSQSDTHGWEGVLLIIPEGGVVEEATVY